MVSPDQSNQGRLAMWKVYFDFFEENPIGTGFSNVQTEIKTWLENQSSDYKSKHVRGDFSLMNAHNMYIHQMVELGLVASLFLYGFL
jgi:O-antigen ligase